MGLGSSLNSIRSVTRNTPLDTFPHRLSPKRKSHAGPWIVSKCINIASLFHHRVGKPFYFSVSNGIALFPREPPPPNRPSNAGGVGRNRDAEPIWLHCVLRTVPVANAIHLAATDHGEFITLVAGKRPSLLTAGNNDDV